MELHDTGGEAGKYFIFIYRGRKCCTTTTWTSLFNQINLASQPIPNSHSSGPPETGVIRNAFTNSHATEVVTKVSSSEKQFAQQYDDPEEENLTQDQGDEDQEGQ